MRTFGSELDKRNGIGPGFDFLRVALALSIIFCHSFLTAQGDRHQFSGPLLGIYRDSLVPMFFALSGFLITASALRLRLKDFLLNRGLRIVPALAVDICISAMLLGPLLTEDSLSTYFTGRQFWAYFTNIAGLVHVLLPGVFTHNPFPDVVNLSLWTIPFEIGCYVIMSALIVTGMIRRPATVAVLTTAAGVAVAVFLIVFGADSMSVAADTHAGAVPKALERFVFHDPALYVFFLLGSLAYLYRHSIPCHGLIAVGCAAAVVCAAAVFPNLRTEDVCAASAPLLVYVAVFIGLASIPKLPLYSRGDYSYGIYLYGFPLQQAIVVLFPGLINPWLHFAISASLVTVVAMGSWHLIEKPTLSLRRKFSFTARKGDVEQAIPGRAATQPTHVEAAPDPTAGFVPSVPAGEVQAG